MKALVIGRAKGVWDEVAIAKTLCTFDTIIVINQAGIDYEEEIDHWVSFHFELLPMWAKQRARKKLPPPRGQFWSSSIHSKGLVPQINGKNIGWIPVQGGSSGLSGTLLALDILKSETIVLCGIPMTSEGEHYDKNGLWREADKHWFMWMRHLSRMLGKVKSMSGRTRDSLGAPTKEWVERCMKNPSLTSNG